MTAADTKKSRAQRAEPFARVHIHAAYALMFTFIVLITIWSSLAPLGSAVVAPGIVSVETHRKVIQHLEGGIIGRILVKDGAKVARGDVLVEMRDVSTKATVERLKSQYFEAMATVARLIAERDGLTEILFPEVVTSVTAEEPLARAAIAAQRKIFESRRDLQGQQQSVLDKRIDRLEEERTGLRRQLEALQTQFTLSEQEIKDATGLFEKQLIRKSRLIDLQRNRAQLEERRSNLQGQLAQAEQQVSELQLRKTESKSGVLTSVVEDIRARQARAHELSRELIVAQDILTRGRVRSPIDGTVVGLQIHSRDGVISPGQTLMEVVPLADDLIVEARVRPEEIEDVRAGLPAQIVLNTLTRRYTQPLAGTLAQVSADRLLDKLTGRPYYLVRVALDPSKIQPGDSKVLAGMSADVLIRTGDRTPLAYLVAPLLRTFSRGMREK